MAVGAGGGIVDHLQCWIFLLVALGLTIGLVQLVRLTNRQDDKPDQPDKK